MKSLPVAPILMVLFTLLVGGPQSYSAIKAESANLCASALSPNFWFLLQGLDDSSTQSNIIEAPTHWYNFKRKRLQKMLVRKVSTFSSKTDLDEFIRDLSLELYPQSYFRSHWEGPRAFLLTEAKRTILTKGLIRYIEYSKLLPSEKSSFLAAIKKVTHWISQLMPWNLSKGLYAGMDASVVEQILLEGGDSIATSELPLRDFLLDKFSTYAMTFTLLSTVILGYSTYANATHQLEDLVGTMTNSLSAIEKSVATENSQLELRIVETYTTEFIKQFHHAPSPEQIEEIKTQVHLKFFNSVQSVERTPES